MRRLGGLVAVLSVFGVAARVGVAWADFSSAQIVAALNAQRSANGIPPVRNDQQMAAGCAAFDSYVIRNGLSVADHHFEDPGLPGYTAAGDEAARTSVLADDVGVVAPLGGIFGLGTGPVFTVGWQYGDPWNHAAFHLFQLMDPALAVSGGDERTARLKDGQWVRLECLNTMEGASRAAPAGLHVYFYPGSGTTVSPIDRNEESEPVLGVPSGGSSPPLIFGYFFGRAVNSVHVRSVSLTVNGKPVGVRGEYVGGASGPESASDLPAGAAAAKDLSGEFNPREPAAVWQPESIGPRSRAVLRLLDLAMRAEVAFQTGVVVPGL